MNLKVVSAVAVLVAACGGTAVAVNPAASPSSTATVTSTAPASTLTTAAIAATVTAPAPKATVRPLAAAPTSALHPARVGPPSAYPDPNITPGVQDPRVTQGNIQQTICLPGYTKDGNPALGIPPVRPPVSYTNGLKTAQIAQLHLADTNPRDYEEDHWVPLEAGGNPTDPRNLWPMPYLPEPGARQKDQVENALNKALCSGQITLDQVLPILNGDWVAFYRRLATTPVNARASTTP